RGGGVFGDDPIKGGGHVEVRGPVEETLSTANTVDGDVAGAWYASVGASLSTSTFHVYAICSASSDATVEETSYSVTGGGGENFAIATCPGGRRAIGGGLGTQGPISPTLVNYGLHVAGPLDGTGTTSGTDDGDVAASWHSAVVNVSGSTQTFKTFALCSATSDATIEATSFNVGDVTGTDVQAAVAACPAGRRALGGGIGTTGS